MKKMFVIVRHDYEQGRDVNQRAFLSEDDAYTNLVEQLQKYDRTRYDFHVDEVVIADWPDKKVQYYNARHHLRTMIKNEARCNENYETNPEAKKEFNRVCKDILKEYVGGEDNG